MMKDDNMTESTALRAYRTARAAYGAAPSFVTASAVLATATTLCCISDDYLAYLDEANDIMDEPIDLRLD